MTGAAEELLTVEEVAVLLRKTKKAVYTMAERNQIAGTIKIGRLLRFRASELRASLGLIPSPSPTISRPRKG